MKTKASRSKWKNILVVDDLKNVSLRIELDENCKIKKKLNPSVKIPWIKKNMPEKNDIGLQTEKQHEIVRNPKLKFDIGIETISIAGNNNYNNQKSNLNITTNYSNEIKTKIIRENQTKYVFFENIDLKLQEQMSESDLEYINYFIT